MALTKGEKIICADVVTEDLLKRCGNNQDVSFDLTVQDRDGDMKSEFIIDSDGFRYYQFNDSNSNGVDIEIDAEKALIQIKHEYDGGDVFSTNNLELSVAGSHLRNKNSGGETGDLCVHGDELTFNGNKVFVDDGDTYLVINETSSVDSITEMYRDGSGNGKPAHFGCFSSDVGDDIGIGSDGVYLCMPYGTDSENYGHIIAGDDECNAGDGSLYHTALDGDGGIGSWRRILDSANFTDYIRGGGGSDIYSFGCSDSNDIGRGITRRNIAAGTKNYTYIQYTNGIMIMSIEVAVGDWMPPYISLPVSFVNRNYQVITFDNTGRKVDGAYNYKQPVNAVVQRKETNGVLTLSANTTYGGVGYAESVDTMTLLLIGRWR